MSQVTHSSPSYSLSRSLQHHSSSSMATRTVTRPIFRASLRSTQANGHSVFIPQCRKIVLEYCDKWPSSVNTRTFLLKHLQSVAKENPHVEFVVKQRNHKEPIARGFYSLCFSQNSGKPQLMSMVRPCPCSEQSTIETKSCPSMDLRLMESRKRSNSS